MSSLWILDNLFHNFPPNWLEVYYMSNLNSNCLPLSPSLLMWCEKFKILCDWSVCKVWSFQRENYRKFPPSRVRTGAGGAVEIRDICESILNLHKFAWVIANMYAVCVWKAWHYFQFSIQFPRWMHFKSALKNYNLEFKICSEPCGRLFLIYMMG